MTLCVSKPDHVGEVADFLRHLDYGADVVDDTTVEATPPAAWPAALARTALTHFIGAWNRAHPDADVVIDGRCAVR